MWLSDHWHFFSLLDNTFLCRDFWKWLWRKRTSGKKRETCFQDWDINDRAGGEGSLDRKAWPWITSVLIKCSNFQKERHYFTDYTCKPVKFWITYLYFSLARRLVADFNMSTNFVLHVHSFMKHREIFLNILNTEYTLSIFTSENLLRLQWYSVWKITSGT